MWRRATAALLRPRASVVPPPPPAAPALGASRVAAAFSPLPTPPLLARTLARSLASAPPRSVLEARQTAKDTSVAEARKVALGHWPSEGARAQPFKSLKRVRKGWLIDRMWDFYGPRRKPNLRPPGHSEEGLVDFGRQHFANHPVLRFFNNLQRIADLEDLKKRGKGPPKKGAGNRKSKGKK